MKAWKISVAASLTYFVVMTGILSVDDGAEKMSSPPEGGKGKAQTLQKPGQINQEGSFLFQYTGDKTASIATVTNLPAEPTKTTTPPKEKKKLFHLKKAGPSVLKSSPEAMSSSKGTPAASGTED